MQFSASIYMRVCQILLFILLTLSAGCFSNGVVEASGEYEVVPLSDYQLARIESDLASGDLVAVSQSVHQVLSALPADNARAIVDRVFEEKNELSLVCIFSTFSREFSHRALPHFDDIVSWYDSEQRTGEEARNLVALLYKDFRTDVVGKLYEIMSSEEVTDAQLIRCIKIAQQLNILALAQNENVLIRILEKSDKPDVRRSAGDALRMITSFEYENEDIESWKEWHQTFKDYSEASYSGVMIDHLRVRLSSREKEFRSFVTRLLPNADIGLNVELLSNAYPAEVNLIAARNIGLALADDSRGSSSNGEGPARVQLPPEVRKQAVDEILRALSSSRTELRSSAAASLTGLSAAKDDLPAAFKKVLDALRIETNVQIIESFLKFIDVAIASCESEALSAETLLIEKIRVSQISRMSESLATLYITAIGAVGNITGGEASVDVLIDIGRVTTSAVVRESVFGALTRVVVGGTQARVESNTPAWQKSGMFFLTMIGPEKPIATRQLAILALGKIRYYGAQEQLLKMLDTEQDTSLRSRIVQSLGSLVRIPTGLTTENVCAEVGKIIAELDKNVVDEATILKALGDIARRYPRRALPIVRALRQKRNSYAISVLNAVLLPEPSDRFAPEEISPLKILWVEISIATDDWRLALEQTSPINLPALLAVPGLYDEQAVRILVRTCYEDTTKPEKGPIVFKTVSSARSALVTDIATTVVIPHLDAVFERDKKAYAEQVVYTRLHHRGVEAFRNIGVTKLTDSTAAVRDEVLSNAARLLTKNETSTTTAEYLAQATDTLTLDGKNLPSLGRSFISVHAEGTPEQWQRAVSVIVKLYKDVSADSLRGELSDAQLERLLIPSGNEGGGS
ncbi:MAG: hypothetical protein NUW37_00865 [Planctomycetes bacterium]|nr:hypothetical protein [Planctomycetota bacterium]